MGLKSEPIDKNTLKVIIPPTRHDILHSCDIMEDVAISYGYNNIDRIYPEVVTIGHQLLSNKISDQLRHEVARCGYTEVLTFSLVRKNEPY